MTEIDELEGDDDRKLVRAFGQLFAEVRPRTSDEIDEILRDEGYDPDELGARLGAAVKAAMAGAFEASKGERND